MLWSLILGAWLAFGAGEVHLVILGDSLTEGYGVAKEAAFPALLQEKFRAAGRPVTVTASGIGGATSASAERRLPWHLKGKITHLLLALGGNDALRGIAPEATRNHLSKAIDLAREKGVKVILAGMKAPPNYGEKFTSEFEAVFPSVAREKKTPLYPFLLEGVAGQPALNLPDGIHPNERGHRKLADGLYPFLDKQL